MIIPRELIEEAKEKLGTDGAITIANELGLKGFDEGKMKAICHWHEEDTPSLVWNTKDNYWKCFGCGYHYDIIDHYMSYHDLSFIDSARRLFAEVGTVYDFQDIRYDTKRFDNYRYPKAETSTNREKVEEYFVKRQISKETLDFADVKQDKQGNIVFEHRNIDNKLLCTKYRPADAIKKGQPMMWWQKDTSTCPVLYGINDVNINKPLLIVEGHIDRLSCIEAGFTNTVSIPHGAEDGNWIEFNWDILEAIETVIVWGDNDKPGEKFVHEATSRIGEHKCKIVRPTKEVEESVKKLWRKYKRNNNKTDANNVLISCGKQEVMNLIINAQDVPMPDIIDLMSCEDVDIHNINKIPTGFVELDKHIHGQLEGTLNIWSGYTGQGKTVVVIQSAIIASIENGEKVFVFSGEMEASQLKNWVVKPLAGKKHTIVWDNGEDRPKGYLVTHKAKEKIREHYKNKIYFYDSYLDTKPETILSRMEYMYKKYGVKVFLLDNLMCVDFSDYMDEWVAQKKFILDLLKFTVKHKVYTHLVAHPKKPDRGSNGKSAYDLYGTSNLGNLTHRLFWVARNYKEDKIHDAEITILKDRPTGVSHAEVLLCYTKETMRLISNKKEESVVFDWEKNADIQYDEKTAAKLVSNSKSSEIEEVFG